jgi:tRNA1Val (adenine37-N6)-methyltransferase
MAAVPSHDPDVPERPPGNAPPPSTDGHLLGGRVRYAQPREGFRSGIEPVLLAAAIAARPGDRVLEGGSGAGAALLCLAARVPGLHGLGVERDPSLVALAIRNAEANGAIGLAFRAADVTALREPDLGGGPFDHALANPPYHSPAGTASPVGARVSAKRGEPGLLAAWARALVAPLRHRGTLTFILPAASLPECLVAMAAARCPASAVLPLWPKPGQPAKLVLVHGVKGGRAPLRLLPGLVLHEVDGRYTPAAEAVLRDAGNLSRFAGLSREAEQREARLRGG